MQLATEPQTATEFLRAIQPTRHEKQQQARRDRKQLIKESEELFRDAGMFSKPVSKGAQHLLILEDAVLRGRFVFNVIDSRWHYLRFEKVIERGFGFPALQRFRFEQRDAEFKSPLVN
jgi:hypothetical protein